MREKPEKLKEIERLEHKYDVFHNWLNKALNADDIRLSLVNIYVRYQEALGQRISDLRRDLWFEECKKVTNYCDVCERRFKCFTKR